MKIVYDVAQAMNVGDVISFTHPVRVPFKWWQRPFEWWLRPQFETREVFYVVKAVTDGQADLEQTKTPGD